MRPHDGSVIPIRCGHQPHAHSAEVVCPFCVFSYKEAFLVGPQGVGSALVEVPPPEIRRSKDKFSPDEVQAIGMSIRMRRQLITFVYHGVIVLIAVSIMAMGEAFGMPRLIGWGLGVFGFHVLSFRIIPMSRWVQEWVIQTATCSGCGHVWDLTNFYRCGCGFVPDAERHAFRPCPHCGKIFSWLECRNCQTSIPL